MAQRTQSRPNTTQVGSRLRRHREYNEQCRIAPATKTIPSCRRGPFLLLVAGKVSLLAAQIIRLVVSNFLSRTRHMLRKEPSAFLKIQKRTYSAAVLTFTKILISVPSDAPILEVFLELNDLVAK